MEELDIRVDLHRMYVTKGDRFPVRFFGRIRNSLFPIAGVVQMKDGSELMMTWDNAGHADWSKTRFNFDLVPLHPEYHDQWRVYNVITNSMSEACWYQTQEDASRACGDNEVPAHIEWRI